tara:strand:- start:79 stop:597 length:519 start_codon:yes stop_codon:yes gene_type:complete
MKIFKKIVLIFIIFFVTNASNSDIKIAYLDLDRLVSDSEAGKLIISNLEKDHNFYLDKFKEKEKKLRDEEKKIISQKNIIDPKEFENKMIQLKEKINVYNKEKMKNINDFNKKKRELRIALIEKLNPILAEYSAQNSFSLILKKKDIILGKTDLDITKDVLKIFNEKVKKIN